jgi:hypothetical protein
MNPDLPGSASFTMPTWESVTSLRFMARIRGKDGAPGKILTLFHQTSIAPAQSIQSSQLMTCGSGGMLGPGIYFATTIDATSRKARSTGVIIQADVTVGIQLIVEEHWPNMNLAFLRSQGADSVKGIGYATGDEIVVYEPQRVRNIHVVKPAAPGVFLCKNSACQSYNQYHTVSCVCKCDIIGCRDRGQYHTGPHVCKCDVIGCRNRGQYHTGSHIYT